MTLHNAVFEPLARAAADVQVVETHVDTRNSHYRCYTLYVNGIPGTVSQMVCVSGTLQGETFSVFTDDVINANVGESIQGETVFGQRYWLTPTQSVHYYTQTGLPGSKKAGRPV